MLALDHYFQSFEKATPDFLARLWCGQRFVGQQRFSGRSTDQNWVQIPWRKQGAGRLYYRIGLNYAPADLQLKALSLGLRVTRSYEGLDNPADVRRKSDGSWHVKAGCRIRVHLTMQAPTRRYHVALVDPLGAFG